MTTIAEKLDIEFPATCGTCDTPVKRADTTWHHCPGCGIDQTSSENLSNRWLRLRLQRFGSVAAHNADFDRAN